jgi:MFS transporter, DHA1 family, multidrug resistance protein
MAAARADVIEPAAPIGVSWKVNLAFIWLGVFVGLMGANFVFPFIPFYIEELGVTDTGRVALFTSISASVTGISLFFTAPLWGALADRFGRKPMFVRALIGAGVLIILMGFVTEVWQFIALRFAMGAFAGTMGAAAALVAATTPREKTGQALGMLQTGMFSANMLGPLIGGVVAEAVGLRESFYVCGALYLTAAILAYIFVKEHRHGPRAGTRAAHGSGNLLASLRIVLAEKQVLIMLGLLFTLWLSTTFVRPLMPISINGFAGPPGDKVTFHLGFMSAEIGKKLASSWVFAAIGLTSTIAALTLGPLGRRVGYRRCVAFAALGTGVLFMPVALAGSYTWFLLFFGMTGIFQGAMVPGMNALIAASTPDGKQGSAFGLAASMQSLALLVGPMAGGALISVFGVIELNYAIIGVVLLGASAVAFIFVREPAPLISSIKQA